MTIDDMASDQEEFARQQSLKIRKPELPKIGVCYECAEPININHNFCCGECRLIYERREYQKRAKV